MGKQQSVKGKPHKGWKSSARARFEKPKMTIQNKQDKESEPLYWMGGLIHGMSTEKLKNALIDANKIILDQQEKIYRLEQSLYEDDEY